MEWYQMALLIVGLLFLLMSTGYPVCFIFISLTFFFFTILFPNNSGAEMYIMSVSTSLNRFTFIACPMFVLMGEFLFRSGIATRACDAVERLLGRVPGRLSILSAGIGILFGAVSGSMAANTAMLGGILPPEMRKRGYAETMIYGPIMAGGSLAVLIPPSSLAILMASLAEISAGKVLIAGVMPGITLGVIYVTYIVVRCKLNPSLAPVYDSQKFTAREVLVSLLKDVFPLFFVIFSVIGTIMLGFATATEASALGALASFLLCFYTRTVSWDMIKKAFFSAFKKTCMVCSIMAGSYGFGQLLAFTGVISSLTKFATSGIIPQSGIIIGMGVVILLLGCFVDSTPLMMISIPIFYPITRALGVDNIWFALYMLLAIKVGNYTPPYGLLLFVMKGVAPKGTKMTTIYKAVMPYVSCDLVLMVLIIIFPAIVTWLPNVMAG